MGQERGRRRTDGGRDDSDGGRHDDDGDGGGRDDSDGDGRDNGDSDRRDNGGRVPEWEVGTASAPITPDETQPHHLIGFAAREGPMDGVEEEIHARAVALEDRAGRRLVVLSFELLYVLPEQRVMLEAVCEERWDVEPEGLLLAPSHTHYGPDYDVDNAVMKADPETEEGLVRDPDADPDLVASYREFVDDTLVSVVDRAVADLEPASLAFHRASCAVAMNRRRPAEDGIHFDPHPDGPVDHDLPVLTATTPDGATKAILFGYACHPTVGMAYCNEVTGDWPGDAMAHLEETHPDATAVFVIGCAGDQKAYPQGSRDLVRQHARTVATAVDRALVTEPRPVRGPLRLAADEVGLDVVKPVGDGGSRRRATVTEHVQYPVQAVGFGTDLAILSLSGEVVAEYARRLKATLAPPVWVAAYANSHGYLPTKRVLAEGGYEARQSFADGRYAPSTEERILHTSVALAERVGASRREVRGGEP